MKIEVISVSTSKKGNRFVQAKVIDGDTPKAGDIFACSSADEAMPVQKAGPAKEGEEA